MLWAVFAAMVALAVALVALPLWRGGGNLATRRTQERAIYRDQMDEVSRDLDRGLVSADQAEAARAEIGRRLLALEGGSDTSTGTPERKRSPLAAIVAGIAVPVLAAAIYVTYGSPGLPGLPAAERAAEDRAAAGAPGQAIADELRARVRDIAGTLERNPNDLRGWIGLADVLTALRRHEEAAVAWQQAMRLAPREAEFASRRGEALTFASGGQVTPDARAAFEEAARRNAGEPRAQYYLGLADRQGGKLRGALDRWLSLEAGSPADAPWLTFLRPRIAELALELGIDDAALAELRRNATPLVADAPPGPTREQVEAAQGMDSADREQMIRGMVDRLAERLQTSPDDADGWARLGRARIVLGETALAKEAYAKAAALRPDDVGFLVAWADSIVAASEPTPPNAAELSPVVDRILARAPNHPRALWLAGALALSAGDPAAAKARWTSLLDVLDPNSVQYVELKKQLEALPPAK
jgi:cytochrome c-type biogenesis protein CcmH